MCSRMKPVIIINSSVSLILMNNNIDEEDERLIAVSSVQFDG